MFAQSMSDENNITDSTVNCGLATDCGNDSFSVHLHSGVENYERPKICVNGM